MSQEKLQTMVVQKSWWGGGEGVIEVYYRILQVVNIYLHTTSDPFTQRTS